MEAQNIEIRTETEYAEAEKKKKMSLSLKNFHWNWQSGTHRFILLIFMVTLMVLCAYKTGFRINTSPSVARGIWLLDFKDKPQKNNYVMLPPEANPGLALAVERKYSEPTSKYLKKVVGAEGDFISYDIQEKSVTVNGEYIFMTETLSTDTEGRPMRGANFPVKLSKGEVWLSSEFIRGYDSRYFGAVSSDRLIKAIPILTFR